MGLAFECEVVPLHVCDPDALLPLTGLVKRSQGEHLGQGWCICVFADISWGASWSILLHDSDN